ncbi:hypothetical protein L6452_29286 [Arctium lappa]|uniref:Uncharacterized protein n=1 Tax=Arctium lappa TaxID=4217 RepID=A0ACB8ZGA7_ARCLA|nr:hypothetical protein L6452_29286 [Arctium lappa]
MASTTTHDKDRRPKFTTNPTDSGGDNGFEMNESDIWNKNDDETDDNDREKPISVGPSRKLQHQRKLIGKSSLPVNVPDWSKISRMKERNNKHYDDDDDDDDGEWLPPHEYLARTRKASFSVHEGVGRTLKGRDLSRLRNAILKKTGFEQD